VYIKSLSPKARIKDQCYSI